ncbi:MAG: hypothetical protein V2B15_13280 [Bacteroidota bacterium]
MKKKGSNIFKLFLPLLSMMIACNRVPPDPALTGQQVKIFPDYTAVTIPPNIAPMNFQIENEGQAYMAVFSNSKQGRVKVKSRSGRIVIPGKAWKKLLDEDRGGMLTIDLMRKNGKGSWERFNQIMNPISMKEIDPYIAYRKIPPANILWKEMGIFQRSLESFEVSPIVTNNVTDYNCMNCHSFNAGDPDQMMFHMRASYGGTLVKNHEEISLVETKSEHTRSAGAYPSWHPGGNLIAFSVNLIKQGFHARMGKISYVHDNYSDIVLYDVNDNSITRPEALSTKNLENLPAWSPDGKKMFYISAPENIDTMTYTSVIYSLMSIEFEEQERSFGKKDTVIDSDDFGHSITFPRVSPGNKLICFIGVDYGYFSINNREADVYLFDLETGEIIKPDVNSGETESYPSWSGNGSWLMFISKRTDGLLSQVWFSYVDEKGKAGKPFVLPQKDPGFYNAYLYNFNRPEFITGEVDISPRKVRSLAKAGSIASTFNEKGSVSLSTGATATSNEPESQMYRSDE